MPRDQAAAETLIEGSDDLGFLAGWGDMSHAQGMAPRRAVGRAFCGSRRARPEGDSRGRIPSSSAPNHDQTAQGTKLRLGGEIFETYVRRSPRFTGGSGERPGPEEATQLFTTSSQESLLQRRLIGRGGCEKGAAPGQGL
jgi:hypothetical protein